MKWNWWKSNEKGNEKDKIVNDDEVSSLQLPTFVLHPDVIPSCSWNFYVVLIEIKPGLSVELVMLLLSCEWPVATSFNHRTTDTREWKKTGRENFLIKLKHCRKVSRHKSYFPCSFVRCQWSVFLSATGEQQHALWHSFSVESSSSSSCVYPHLLKQLYNWINARVDVHTQQHQRERTSEATIR